MTAEVTEERGAKLGQRTGADRGRGTAEDMAEDRAMGG